MRCGLILLFVIVSTIAEQIRFDNYQVLRVTPSEAQHLTALRELQEDYYNDFKFWTDVGAVGRPADIMVSPQNVTYLSNFLHTSGMPADVLVQDVQSLIDNQRPSNHTRATGIDWNDYYRVDDIYSWLDDLAQQYPETVTVVVGGQSFEGREIRGVKISSQSGNPAVFIDGGIHAREWISPAVVTYMLNELLTNPELQTLIESFDWYFFPTINPDGYEYTFTTDRTWRKTRSDSGARCYGADANRNWGFHWMEGGASSNPCTETYAGAKAFSEIETSSLSEFMQGIPDIQVYITFHSYGQYLMLPYGYTNERYPDYENLMAIATAAAGALEANYGTLYSVGNIVDLLYVGSGGSIDWVKGILGTPLTYAFELRDTGAYGFLLPADQIIPTGIETLDAVIKIAEAAKKL